MQAPAHAALFTELAVKESFGFDVADLFSEVGGLLGWFNLRPSATRHFHRGRTLLGPSVCRQWSAGRTTPQYLPISELAPPLPTSSPHATV